MKVATTNKPCHYAHVISVYLLVSLTVVLSMLLAPAAPAADNNRFPVTTDTARSPEEQIQFAEGLLERKFYKMAEKEFRIFIDEYSDHELAPSAMFGLIEGLRGQNKLDACLSRINQFQSKWPEHELAPKLYLWKGELLLQKGKLHQAEQSLKRLRFSPDSATSEAALYFLARCYAQQGKLENTVKTYQKLAEKPFDGKHEYRPYAAYALGRYYYSQDKKQKAKQTFTKLVEHEDIPENLRLEAIYRLAEYHFQEEDFEEAIRLYELLLVEYPDSRFATDAQKRRAWGYFSLENYEKALSLAKEWKNKWPSQFDYEIEYILGASLAAQGKAEDALKYLQRISKAKKPPREYRRLSNYHAIRMHLKQGSYQEVIKQAEHFFSNFPEAPGKPDIHYFAGEALYQLEDYAEAVEHFRKAMKSQDAQWAYFMQSAYGLAECHLQLNEFRKAASVYRQTATALPESKAEEKAQSLLRAGRCARKADQWEEAIKDFQAVLQDHPNILPYSRIAAKLLGETYAQEGQFDRATELIRDLIQKENKPEGRQRLQFFLGYLYYRQGKYSSAEKRLKEAIEDGTKRSVVHDARYFLTGTLLEQDKEDEALETFAPILELAPEKRPEFASDFLFRLERVYFKQHQYDVSRNICRWLADHPDTSVSYRANLRLAENHINTGDLDKATDLLQNMLSKYEDTADADDSEAPAESPGAEISSLLGECYLEKEEQDRAISAFLTTLNTSGVAQVHKTRANWGMAKVLLAEKRYEQARDYAVSAFVLGNHPVYTPQSMLIAIKALHELGNDEEAKTTWQELQKRFSSFAQQHSDEKVIRKLIGQDDNEDASP